MTSLWRSLAPAQPRGLFGSDNDWLLTRAINGLGFGPMTQATQAGRPNGYISNGPVRPNDYLAPVAETISPTMGAYGAGQMAAEGSRAIGQGDYLGGGAGLALGMAGMIPGAPKKGIRAFHGSPHDFDRFSLDKIGTGEGAQAYGHGLYFAEKQEVARAYEGMLAGNGYDPAVIARDALIASDGDAAKALERIARETPPKMGLPEMDILTDNYGVASQIMQDHIAGEPMPLPARGRMYEVRINADPEDFLDWDKPLSQQSEKVRVILDRAASPQRFGHAKPADAEMLRGSGQRPAIIDQGNGSLNGPSGGVMQKSMGSMVDNGQVLDPVVGFVPVDMMNVLGSKQGAAQMLGHDAPMLFDKLPVAGGDNVSLGVNGASASKGGVAGTAAEGFGVHGDVSGGAVKGFPALSADQLRHMTGSQLLDSFYSRDAATEALRNQGVAGIRYLDRGSRRAGDGSRNYVVFDDKLIDILRKYGLFGSLGMGGASGLFGTGEQSQ